MYLQISHQLYAHLRVIVAKGPKTAGCLPLVSVFVCLGNFLVAMPPRSGLAAHPPNLVYTAKDLTSRKGGEHCVLPLLEDRPTLGRVQVCRILYRSSSPEKSTFSRAVV